MKTIDDIENYVREGFRMHHAGNIDSNRLGDNFYKSWILLQSEHDISSRDAEDMITKWAKDEKHKLGSRED